MGQGGVRGSTHLRMLVCVRAGVRVRRAYTRLTHMGAHRRVVHFTYVFAINTQVVLQPIFPFKMSKFFVLRIQIHWVKY